MGDRRVLPRDEWFAWLMDRESIHLFHCCISSAFHRPACARSFALRPAQSARGMAGRVDGDGEGLAVCADARFDKISGALFLELAPPRAPLSADAEHDERDPDEQHGKDVPNRREDGASGFFPASAAGLRRSFTAWAQLSKT